MNESLLLLWCHLSIRRLYGDYQTLLATFNFQHLRGVYDPPSNITKNANSKTRYADHNDHLAKMSLAALGIVFGDISTSPIYAIRECFHGEYGIAPTHANITGVLSLMFWSLVMIVCVKYLIFVFRADNSGEGGVLALTALIRGETNQSSKGRSGSSIVALGLFAACLLYGDGMITPAISVMSAVEGIGIVTPMFESYVIPLTILFLCTLFLIQRHGTAIVGGLFGPVIVIWLCFLAITGVLQILQRPQILEAAYPWHAFRFLILNKLHGFLVLGAVFLVVTGTEALYADMGHFGTRPIRLTWFAVVFPSLSSIILDKVHCCLDAQRWRNIPFMPWSLHGPCGRPYY